MILKPLSIWAAASFLIYFQNLNKSLAMSIFNINFASEFYLMVLDGVCQYPRTELIKYC